MQSPAVKTPARESCCECSTSSKGGSCPEPSGAPFRCSLPTASGSPTADLADQKIKKIPITGGTSITLCEGSLQWGGAWGDDGTFVFRGAEGLDARVGRRRRARVTHDAWTARRARSRHVRPQFLPGGRQLLFTVMTQQGEPQFAVSDLGKTGYRIVAKGGANGQYVASGHLTFVRGTTLFAMPFDLVSPRSHGRRGAGRRRRVRDWPVRHGRLFRLGVGCPRVLLEPGDQRDDARVGGSHRPDQGPARASPDRRGERVGCRPMGASSRTESAMRETAAISGPSTSSAAR